MKAKKLEKMNEEKIELKSSWLNYTIPKFIITFQFFYFFHYQ